MDSIDPIPLRRPWMPARPSSPADGPPGLAALLDAERSMLRETLESMRLRHAAHQAVALREAEVVDALKLQEAAKGHRPGMRGRLQSNERDSRLLVADARQAAAAALSAVDATDVRVLANERRLQEIRGFVDSVADEASGELLAAMRRTSAMPRRARLYPTIAAFISEEPSRAQGDVRLLDLIGDPLGSGWMLEERDQPWVATRWRAAWATRRASHEIYAVELVVRPHAARRVWLLGEVDASAVSLGALIVRQDERNSLASLAAAVDANAG